MRKYCSHWTYKCTRCGAQCSGPEPVVVLFMEEHEASCCDECRQLDAKTVEWGLPALQPWQRRVMHRALGHGAR